MSDKWLITSNGQLLFFCLLCVSILLVSCERRDLTYYEVSEITLTADWNDSGLDDKEQKYGATAVFYPRNGGEPKIFMMGDRSGDAVRLPMGVYDIIVFNRSFNDFSNIAFRGNSYETLEAYARKVETRPLGLPFQTAALHTRLLPAVKTSLLHPVYSRPPVYQNVWRQSFLESASKGTSLFLLKF